MNKNDTEKRVIFAAALRLSFVVDACSVKALIHYYGGRFIFVARINRVASNGNAPYGPIHTKDARFFCCGNSAADISKPHTF